MGYNKKLMIAGLAAGVSALMLYKAAKEREEKKKKQQQQQQQQHQYAAPQQQHTSADYNHWGAAAPFLAAGAVGAGAAAASSHSSGFSSLFGSSSSNSAPSDPPPVYTPGDLPFSALTDEKYITSILAACVMDQNLHHFFDFHTLRQIAQRLAASGALVQAADAWQLPPALAVDLCKLSLFDVCFLLDDSASMHSEGTRRRDALRHILAKAADAAGRFDPDGMEVRWMNSHDHATIHTADDARRFTSGCAYQGRATPLGGSLEEKILRPLVLNKAAQPGQLMKPVLVIIITDGRPTGEGERDNRFKRVIKTTRNELERLERAGHRADADAISYMVAAVGNDTQAQDFLDEIDSSEDIGEYVDVCSDYLREKTQIKRATGIDFTEELHCLKILLGGIDSHFDSSDEGTQYVSSRTRRKKQERKEALRRKYYSQRQALRSQVQQMLNDPTPSAAPPPAYQHTYGSTAEPAYDVGAGSKAPVPPTAPGAPAPYPPAPAPGAQAPSSSGYPPAPGPSNGYPPPAVASTGGYPSSGYPPAPDSNPAAYGGGYPPAAGSSPYPPTFGGAGGSGGYPPAGPTGYPPAGGPTGYPPPGPDQGYPGYYPPQQGGGASGQPPYPPAPGTAGPPDAGYGGGFSGGFVMPNASPYPQQPPYGPQ